MWMIGFVWKIHLGVRVCMINSYGWATVYEKFIGVARFMWEIRLCVRNLIRHPPSKRDIYVGVQICMRNTAVYEIFTFLPPSIREIHVDVQICMRNSAVYEIFTLLPPSIREIHVGVQICRRNSAVYEISTWLPPDCNRNSRRPYFCIRNLLITDTKAARQRITFQVSTASGY
jgi:Na+/serine symporter